MGLFTTGDTYSAEDQAWINSLPPDQRALIQQVQIASAAKSNYESGIESGGRGTRAAGDKQWAAIGGQAGYDRIMGQLNANPDLLRGWESRQRSSGGLGSGGDVLASLALVGGLAGSGVITPASGGTAAGGDVLAGTGYAGGTALPAAGADLTAYGAGASGTAGAYGGGTAGGTLAGVTGGGGVGSGVGAGAAAAGTDWTDPGTYLPLIPSLLGIKGAGDAADKQDELAREYMAMGAPYRGRLAELYNNPEAYLATQRGDIEKNVQRGTDIMSRSLSMGGNPVGSGNALQQLQSYASEGMDNQLYGRLNAERQNMANFGGLSQFNSAAPQAGQNAIDAGSKVYDAYGAAGSTLNDIFGTKKPRYDPNTGQRIS